MNIASSSPRCCSSSWSSKRSAPIDGIVQFAVRVRQFEAVHEELKAFGQPPGSSRCFLHSGLISTGSRTNVGLDGVPVASSALNSSSMSLPLPHARRYLDAVLHAETTQVRLIHLQQCSRRSSSMEPTMVIRFEGRLRDDTVFCWNCAEELPLAAMHTRSSIAHESHHQR